MASITKVFVKKLTLCLYIISLLGWVLYSYSQVDLNLTLSQNLLYLYFQEQLTSLGYFHRPLSTAMFILLLSMSSLSYYLLLKLTKLSRLNKLEIIRLIIFTALIGLLAYPAFSHDLFNYMFDARIFAKYGLNPYQFKALDFPHDTWTRFMHWTHRVYPYGPSWLLISLLPSYLGLQIFTLTLLLFKFMFSIAYMTSCFLIYKIQNNKSGTSLLPLVLFSLNPLIVIETLISPHNESMIIMSILLSLFLLQSGRQLTSFTSLVLGSLIKYTSGTLLIAFIYKLFVKSKSHFDLSHLSLLYLASYTVSFLYLIYQRELLPWYFTVFVGLAIFIKRYPLLKNIVFILSITILFKYIPYLYTGSWELANENIYITIQAVTILFVIIFSISTYVKNK